MNRKDIKELYYITHIENVSSILTNGILSHNEAKKLKHYSIAMEEIQQRRQDKEIPNAGTLHDYANLYFDAHNPMLSKCRDQNNIICVLCVSPDILELPGVIVSDHNAASEYARFYKMEEGLMTLDESMVFAQSWKHPENIIEEWQHKSIKCAEVLIPGKIAPGYITRSYVDNETAEKLFKAQNIKLYVAIKSDIFF